MSEKITRPELLDDLKRLAAELGRSPYKDEITSLGAFGFTTYYNRFGSLPAALEAAGLDARYGKVTAEELVKDLKRVADKLKKPPTEVEYNEAGKFSHQSCARHLGSWNGALEAAGLTPNRNHGVTKDELVVRLKNAAAILGKAPTIEDLRHFKGINGVTVRDRFGSYGEGLEAAGLERNWKPAVQTTCDRCGIPISKTVGMYERSERDYCSMDCRARDNRTQGTIAVVGSNWQRRRKEIIERDGKQCVVCGMTRDEHRDAFDRDLTVHHINPRREYIEDGVLDETANESHNLVTLCSPHHTTYESLPVRPQIQEAAQ